MQRRVNKESERTDVRCYEVESDVSRISFQPRKTRKGEYYS
jgi:hypothetical protein